MNYGGIVHCSFIVSDIEKSLKFYCDILEMVLDSSRPDLGYPGAWLHVGEQHIHLLQLENPDPMSNRPEHGGRDRHTAILINGYNQLIARLQQAKIEISPSKSGRAAFFCRDPDGNALEFISDK